MFLYNYNLTEEQSIKILEHLFEVNKMLRNPIEICELIMFFFLFALLKAIVKQYLVNERCL